jgi:hypothetical protein
MERTHRLSADRDWLPKRVRRSARLVSGAVWAGTGAAIVGVVALVPAAVVLWKGFLLGGAGAAFAGDRAGRSMMRRQISRMARGELALAEVDARPEGELVVVRGTIEAEEPLRGVLVDVEGVYRRLTVAAGTTWIHEAAVDFTLVDERGDRLRIQAAGARWLVPPRELLTYPAARLTGADVPRRVREIVGARTEVAAAERVLAVGTAVQIVGYKTRSADISGGVVDYRLPPQRATLCSGPELPLVITRLEDLEA